MMLFALTFSLACGSKDCAELGDATAKDWCYYDLAVAAAEKDDLDGAIAEIQKIQDPIVQSATTKRIIEESPLRLDAAGAERLCTQLDQKGSETCLRDWKRPHLWGE
ncbi:MAG: hypothetical protein GY913_20140 [Proteobacteria bacterium]|nr:hypothetical protein [Pseudomonadota bacterium]MCP4919217.1 hypothetical protein [Pseudomonadota bacterium]